MEFFNKIIIQTTKVLFSKSCDEKCSKNYIINIPILISKCSVWCETTCYFSLIIANQTYPILKRIKGLN